MCGRFVQTPVPIPQAIWPALADELVQIPERYNLAPTQRAAVVRLKEDAPALYRLQWGLAQPIWATKHLSLINARIDKVAVSPVYRGAFAARHAAVPMAGFYEWRVEAGKKQPYFIHAPDEILWAAALWESRADDPERAPDGSFTIITQQAEDQFKHVHDRMPVFLPPASVEDWLAADDQNRHGACARNPCRGVSPRRGVSCQEQRVDRPQRRASETRYLIGSIASSRNIPAPARPLDDPPETGIERCWP